jgi:2'-5' RNA ligase
MAEKFGNTLIVAPVEPFEKGHVFGEYQSLPLHVTIQPWFEQPNSEPAFLNALSNTIFTHGPFAITRGDFDVLGHNKQVDLIDRGTGNLAKLHHDIGETIVRFGGVLHPSVAERAFMPHVTRVAGRQMDAQILIDAIQFVHRQADGSKLVGRRYPFRGDKV